MISYLVFRYHNDFGECKVTAVYAAGKSGGTRRKIPRTAIGPIRRVWAPSRLEAIARSGLRCA